MYTRLLVFIIILSYTQVYGQECFHLVSGISSNSIPQFQASVIDLKPNVAKMREYQYNVTLKTTTTSRPIDIIASVSFIQNYFDPTALDFAVTVQPQASYFKLVFAMNVQANWTSAHIHYIASSRQDFRVGSFVLEKSAELAANVKNKQKSVNLKHSFGLRKWETKPEMTGILVYLSGIKYSQRFIDISIGGLSVDPTGTINFSLNISNQRYNIETLYISYILYAKVNTPLMVTISNSILTFLEKSLNKQIDNSFVGLIRLNSKKLSTFFQPRRVLSAIIQPPTIAELIPRTQLSQFIDSFQQEGIQVQLNPSGMPTVGDEGTGEIPSCTTFDQCLRLGGIVLNYEGSLLKCLICRKNSYYDLKKEYCVCQSDFYADADQDYACIHLASLCLKDQIYQNGKCQTPSSTVIVKCQTNQTFNKITRKCECEDGFISYNKSGVLNCAIPCKSKFTFDVNTQKCICQQPFLLDFSNNCVLCDGSIQKWNPLVKACECVVNAVRIFEHCFTCSQNADYDKVKKKCICKQGYQGNGAICRRFKTQQQVNEYTNKLADTKPSYAGWNINR